MENSQKNLEQISWEISEYDRPERSWKWYLIASIVGLLLVIYSLFTANFLFALIIIMAAIIIVLHGRQEPKMVKFMADTEGISIGSKFYDYDEFKHVSVIYKVRDNTKNLYLTFSNALKNRLSIPLMDQDPLLVRNFLVSYIEEDLDRTDEPLSESLSKLLRL